MVYLEMNIRSCITIAAANGCPMHRACFDAFRVFWDRTDARPACRRWSSAISIGGYADQPPYRPGGRAAAGLLGKVLFAYIAFKVAFCSKCWFNLSMTGIMASVRTTLASTVKRPAQHGPS